MSVEENLRMFNAQMDAFNAQDWERFDEFNAESIVVSGPVSPEPIKGRDALREGLQPTFTAFPDFHVKVERAFGQDDWVCAELTSTGTNTGPLQGPGGETIPATHKPVRVPWCLVSKAEGGKFTEVHQYVDQLGQMAQLGLAP